ncbi:MAG: efflux RND transporter periplasmic adaptor subunit [Blastocatellia bacterium]
MKKSLLKKILIGGAVAGIVALIAYSFRPTPINVETAQVERGLLRTTIDAEGKTRVRDRFVVASPIAGKLTRISLRHGDAVKRDQVVASIEPLPMAPLDPRQRAEAGARVATAEQMKREAETGIERIRTECQQADREFARTGKLVETGDLSRQEYERARNASQTCRQQLEAATYRARAVASEVDVAKAALIAVERAGQSGKSAPVLVRAPVNGRVLKVVEESERVITAGAPLIELSNSSLELVIDLLSADAVKVNPGASVLIEGWGGGQRLQARIRLIEPSAFTKVSALGIEEQRVNVIADFLDPGVPLGDGYRVEARIVIWESNEALKIPMSALFRQGEAWNVFVVENGMAKQSAVEPGHRSAFDVEVLRGLQAGENVIVHPAKEIADGMRVIPVQAMKSLK